MSQKLDSDLAEGTFLRVQGDACCFNSLECCDQVLVVICLALSEYEHIIHQANYALQPFQDVAHSLLEELWCTRDSKRELVKPISPERCDKCCEWMRFWSQWNLPEATVCVQRAEYRGYCQLSQGVVNFRDRVDLSEHTR